MTTSVTVTKMLGEVAKVPGDGKIKVSAAAVRELAQSDALNRSAALAGISILAFLADKTPMSIEERKHVEFVIDAMSQANRGDPVSINEAIKSLTQVVGYYTENVG
ncbi:hypothetical protein D3C76_78070 [compost metagenome]